MKEYISKSAQETIKFAAEFTSHLETKFPSSPEGVLQGATVVGLYGELGAGKTTFMKGVAKFFGIEETIQSPTFVIEKVYELKLPTSNFQHLIHIDAYRIEKSDEMINLGWNEIIADPKNLIFVEWPERITDIMPPHTKIQFEHFTENQRKIQIK